MNTLFSFLLKRYHSQDQELILKARFVLITTLVTILALILAMVYSIWLSGMDPTLITIEASGFFIMIGALLFLIKGRFIFAVHTLFIAGFATSWLVLFYGGFFSQITRLDTIVFVIGLMAAMPMLFFQSRTPMILYFVINLVIFFGFVLHLSLTTDLAGNELMDYLLDNTIVMVFVFTVAFNLFAIYRRVLNSMQKELKERQKAEKALEEMRILLSNTINSMPSAIIGVDSAFKVILWNDEAAALTGLDPAAAENLSLLDIVPQLTEFKGKIQQVMTDHIVSKNFKTTLIFPPNQQTLDMTIYPLQKFDVGGAVIRLDDAFERVHLEEMMVQSEKMISMGWLAAGMAHELNNPLAGMIQSTQVIRNRLTKPMPANERVARPLGLSMDTLRTYVENRNILMLLSHVNDAGKQAAKIVDNMLGFVQKNHSGMESHDMATLMEQTVILAQNDFNLKKRYDFKNIEILREFQPDIPRVHCEKNKIQQVVFNLLKNASEAMGEFPSDRNPRIILRLHADAVQVCMEIEDNGPGMDEETRKRIFDPFFTTKPVDQGTGLGLSVSYFIITEEHGGTIEVDAAQGLWTRFVICLPLGIHG